MTVFVIAVAMLLPALLYALNTNLLAVLQRFQHDTRITLFLLNSLPDSRAREASESLLTDSAIDSVEYISADQALGEFSASSGFIDIVADLEANPLPATIIITPAATEPGSPWLRWSNWTACGLGAWRQFPSYWT